MTRPEKLAVPFKNRKDRPKLCSSTDGSTDGFRWLIMGFEFMATLKYFEACFSALQNGSQNTEPLAGFHSVGC